MVHADDQVHDDRAEERPEDELGVEEEERDEKQDSVEAELGLTKSCDKFMRNDEKSTEIALIDGKSASVTPPLASHNWLA